MSEMSLKESLNDQLRAALNAAEQRNRELTRQVEQLQEDKAYLSDAMQSAINLIVALKEQRARMHLEDALGARGNLAPMQAMRRANDLVERWRKPQYYGMVSQLYKDGCDDTFRNCAALLEYALTAPPSSSDPGRADTGREET